MNNWIIFEIKIFNYEDVMLKSGLIEDISYINSCSLHFLQKFKRGSQIMKCCDLIGSFSCFRKRFLDLRLKVCLDKEATGPVEKILPTHPPLIVKCS